MSAVDLEAAAGQALKPAPALAIADLRHRYGERVALDGLGFTLDAGELAILLGPNGAGKTTLFSLITQLYDRQSGADFESSASDLRQNPHRERFPQDPRSSFSNGRSTSTLPFCKISAMPRPCMACRKVRRVRVFRRNRAFRSGREGE